MIWCDVARMLIIGSVPLAAAFGVLTLGQLYAVAITAGRGHGLLRRVLPELPARPDRRRTHLVDGNGKLGSTQSFAQVAGPGLGGGLVGLVGAARAMTADAISYAVSVAVPAGHPGPRGTTAARPRQTLRSRDRRRPARSSLRHPILRKIVACTGHREPVRRHGRRPGDHLPGPGPARPARRYRPADRRGQPRRRRRRGAVGPAEPAHRLGPHHLVLDARPRPCRSCSSRWPSRAGGSRCSRSASPAFSFSAVVYNVAQVSYRQAICPPRLLGRMNAAVRWVVWGTLPLGGLLGGALGTAAGRARHAVDRVRGQLGGRLVGVLLPAARDARHASDRQRT